MGLLRGVKRTIIKVLCASYWMGCMSSSAVALTKTPNATGGFDYTITREEIYSGQYNHCLQGRHAELLSQGKVTFHKVWVAGRYTTDNWHLENFGIPPHTAAELEQR